MRVAEQKEPLILVEQPREVRQWREMKEQAAIERRPNCVFLWF